MRRGGYSPTPFDSAQDRLRQAQGHPSQEGIFCSPPRRGAALRRGGYSPTPFDSGTGFVKLRATPPKRGYFAPLLGGVPLCGGVGTPRPGGPPRLASAGSWKCASHVILREYALCPVIFSDAAPNQPSNRLPRRRPLIIRPLRPSPSYRARHLRNTPRERRGPVMPSRCAGRGRTGWSRTWRQKFTRRSCSRSI